MERQVCPKSADVRRVFYPALFLLQDAGLAAKQTMVVFLQKVQQNPVPTGNVKTHVGIQQEEVRATCVPNAFFLGCGRPDTDGVTEVMCPVLPGAGDIVPSVVGTVVHENDFHLVTDSLPDALQGVFHLFPFIIERYDHGKQEVTHRDFRIFECHGLFFFSP